MQQEFRRRIRSALALNIPFENGQDAHEQRALAAVPASVLVLFAFPKGSDDPSVLLTVRTHSVETHKGQIAFPGGVTDDEDHADQGLITTALRETEEEVGIARSQIEILGQLPQLYTLTRFLITPVIGVMSLPLEEVVLNPNPQEIAEMFWVPLSALRSEGTYRLEAHRVGAVSFPTHVYQFNHHRIWGATASVLKNLLDRLGKL